MSSTRSESPLAFAAAPNADALDWTKAWSQTLAKGASHIASHNSTLLTNVAELIDCPVVSVDADTTVEEACEVHRDGRSAGAAPLTLSV